ncbi:hypothetical protein [Edaphovirga cremea]|uniref:hypothetical protein n=1 Tax=Edaphovirga cremea TaxID=2267246 RepID=UPI0039894241
MSQIPYRANLQTMTFPLLSELSGRTIINPQGDNTYARFVSSDGQSPVDTGIAQIFYCHNVMPSTYGWQSIRFNTIYGPPPGGSLLDFERTDRIYAAQVVSSGTPPVESIVSTGFKTQISIAGIGANMVYVVDPVTGNWKSVFGAPVVAATTVISVATVNGASYIYFSGIGCYIYNNITNTLTERVLAGLDKVATVGIVAANGYLNAYNKTGVAWSSTVNVEDFVPSDTSGAGGGQVQEARGEIVTAVATNLGYILYTKENAVSVIFSGNAEFPWNFKAIPASGGVSSVEVVSQEQAAGFQQVYSTNGMQQVTHARCATVTPNVTDFIAGNTFEDFNSSTNEFIVTKFDWSMRKKLSVVCDRYIIISYGLSPTADMTHALILDLTQTRMGKIKLTHTSCFELRSINAAVTELPRDSIAFLQRDGTVKVIDFSLLEEAPDSVLILGKYQYVRQKLIELNQLEIESVETEDTFTAWALPSLNGKTFQPAVAGYLLESSPDYRKYSWDGALGTNVSWMFKGTFNINSLIGWFSLVGNP